MTPELERPELSIVSTIYNDAGNVSALVEALLVQARGIHVSFEIILVNDSSTDGSEAAIRDMCKKYKEVKGISLARNYGQQIAMSAGIREATGKYVLILDGDLENPVDAIPQLYSRICRGYDIVYTVARHRPTLINQMTSQFFWFVVRKLLAVDIVKNQLMMKMMSRRMIDNFNSYSEITRSVAGIVHDVGLKWDCLEVEPRRRISGRSSYSFFSRLNLFIDIILNLSKKPMDFVIFVGFFTFIFSMILAVYWVYSYYAIGTLPGYTSIILSIFFFGSLTIFTLGIASRYLALIYLEVRGRPLYLIKDRFNL